LREEKRAINEQQTESKNQTTLSTREEEFPDHFLFDVGSLLPERRLSGDQISTRAEYCCNTAESTAVILLRVLL